LLELTAQLIFTPALSQSRYHHCVHMPAWLNKKMLVTLTQSIINNLYKNYCKKLIF